MFETFLILATVISLFVLYKFLPNRKIFLYFCLSLIVVFAIAGLIARTQQPQQDMNEALLRVLDGFKGQGGLVELQPIFQDLGLDAACAASVINSMANSVDKIREAQAKRTKITNSQSFSTTFHKYIDPKKIFFEYFSFSNILLHR